VRPGAQIGLVVHPAHQCVFTVHAGAHIRVYCAPGCGDTGDLCT